MQTYVAPVTQELNFWTQYFSTTTQDARIWVQVDKLAAAASTTIYLYYGNSGASTASDAYAPFSYSTTTDLYYVLRNDAAAGDSLLVYSYVDNNVVQFSDSGATTTLNRGEATSTQSFSSSTVVRATGPLMAKYEDAGAKNFDSLVPQAFASTTFTVGPRNNNTELWYIGSPFGYASVDMWNGSATTSFVVATDTVHYQSLGIPNGSAGIVESDIPVVLAYEYNTGDGLTPYPATMRDLYGVYSNNVYIGATQNSTSYTATCSAGAGGNGSGIARGSRTSDTSCTNGSNGTGAGVRLSSINHPVGAMQNADSDGGEASAFWPFMEFSTEYMLPVTTSYVTVVCAPETGTVNLTLYDNTDTAVTSTTCSGSGSNPGQAYFGNDDTNNYTAGYYIASTDSPPKPFYAYYEDHSDVGSDSNGGDEQNFTAAVQGRKFAYPELSYSYGAEELSTEPFYNQSSFRIYANEDAEPPTDPWPAGSEDVAEDTAVTAATAVSDGDIIRVRLGVTVTNVSADAGDNNFTLQYAEAASCDSGGLSWTDVGAVGSGAVWRGYNNASLSDGSTLSTTTLSGATVLGTYEESNDSALFPNAISTGQMVEHDWVLENNGANTNSAYCFRAVLSSGQTFPTYSLYPQVETNSAPAEPQPQSPFDNAKLWDLTPSFTFSATDEAGDDLNYQVQVDDTYDFSSPEIDVSSVSQPTAFANVTNPSDKAPFTAGHQIRYTVQSNLTDNTTYYWRVRAIDPTGSGEWGNWLSPPQSFTTDTSISVSTWFQTTEEQFDTDSLLATYASTSDDVRLPGPIGEFGTTTLTGYGWTTVTLSREYADLVVVASPRYDGADVQRTARVRNKGTNSFDIKVDNHASTTNVSGNTTVDWVAMEAGTWTMIDGGTGSQVIAGTVNTDGQFGNGCTSGTSASVTWSSAFSSAPVVLHTVTSNNDTQWVSSVVGDGSNNPPTTTTGVFDLMTSFAACNHTAAEDIDYIAFEPVHGTTNDGVEYEATIISNTLDRAADALLALPYSTSFSSTPVSYIVAQHGVNGGNGSTAFTDISGTVTTTNYYGAVDEEGPGADRSGATEDGGVVSWTAASGTIEAAYAGTITATAVDFDDAEVGNRWGEASWNDNETNGTILYQVEYYSGGSWALIPDSEIVGNSTGTSTSPIDLSNIDTFTYNVIRLVANLSSASFTLTPILYDWTVSWRQSVYTPTHDAPFDNEKVGTTTPELMFSTSDPEGESITYVVEWSTDRTFATASTATSGISSGFRNSTNSGDTSPFNSGDTIGFTIPSGALSAGQTYWWRVKGIDTGTSGWSFWSDEWSVTASTSVSISTWFQTSREQFENDTVSGVQPTVTDDVRIKSSIGEYGTVILTPNTWTTIDTSDVYSNMVVVASVRYGTADTQRAARVRNKGATSFDIKVDDEASPDGFSGTTTVDYLVMEAGAWTLDDGGSGTQVIAGTVADASSVACNGTHGAGDTVTFSPAFGSSPAVIATIATNNDSSWAVAGVNNGTAGGEPTASGMDVYMERSFASCVHNAEDIDYVAFDVTHGTLADGEFEAVLSADVVTGPPSNGGVGTNYATAFPGAPQVTLAQQLGEDGGNGGYALTNIGTAGTASTVYNSIDEDGPGADRNHTTEPVAILAFEAATGTLQRVGAAQTGTIDSQDIVFSDGSGPKWGQLYWTDQEPATSTIRYQVYYASGTTYALIPDGDLPGNSSGTTTSPISLGTIDTGTYDTLRLRANFACTDEGTCPILDDWTVEWSEGIVVSGTAYAYDEATPLSSGTVHIALNGVEQARTGTISSCSCSINNVNAFPNDIITVWIDGAAESNEAVAVTKYDGTNDVTGVTLYERHLTLGSDDDPTLTNADLGQYDSSVSSNEDIFHEVDGSNNLAACVAGNGCGDVVLYVKSGTTYRPDSTSSGNVATHDVRINGAVVADNNTFTVSGSWDNTGGYIADGSTVIFSATSSSESIDSTGAATSSFYAVTFGQGSGTATWTPVTILDVNENLTVAYGTYSAATSTTIAGNLTIGANGVWQKGSGTTTFDGTGIAFWTDNTATKQDMGNLNVNGTSKTVRLQSDVAVTNVDIVSGNTLDVTANNYALEVKGNFTNTGTFTAQNGTVTFTATTSGHTISLGPSSFANVTFNGSGGNWAFPDTNITATKDVLFTNGIVTLPTGTFSVGGSLSVTGGQFVHNNGTVKMTSTVAGKTITPVNSPFYNLTFFGSGGTWSFGQANATTSNNFQIDLGAVTLPSGILYVAGDFGNEAGSFNANSGQVHFNTTGTQKFIEAKGSSFNDLYFTGSSGGGGDWYNTGWSHRFSITIPAAQVDDDVTDFPVYVDLSMFGDHFWTSAEETGADIRVTAADGVTELPYELVSFATSTHTGELYFKADTLASTTDSTFYFYYGNSLASAYGEGDPYGSQAVWTNGYLAVYHLEEEQTGTGNANVYKDSTSANADADDYLATAATTGQLGKGQDFTTVTAVNDYIDVPYTVLNGQTDVVASWWMRTSDTGQQAIVSGAESNPQNNEFLLFFTNNTTFSPYNNGSNISFGISSIADNTWRYVVYEANDAANRSYLWLDGAPDNENPRAHTIGTLTIASGGLMLGQEQDTVGDGFQSTQGLDGYLDEMRFATTTRTDGWISTEYNNQYTVSSFYSTSTYESVASRTFVDTNVTAIGDLTIASGLVTLPPGTLTLDGSLVNSGLFDANSGTVLFAATTTGHTVNVGGSDFYNVTFNNAGGGWTVTSDATSTNNWTLTAANDFTAQSGVRIAVQGTFANSIPSATDWTGSVLALVSGTSYTVGSKAQPAETYGTLEISANTDIRLWQANAASYSIDGTGSLYSQDHAGTDGDLYIWGDYVRTSGTDYWSTLTDFDGTGIAGSPRQVDVRFASGASASFIGSTLEVRGTSTATTTLANQGTGAYSLSITDGTINAQYYTITDTDSEGFALLGSTTVTSLADGTYVLAADTGTMLTVSSSTIDTNPELQIQRVSFATSSGVTSGSNVTASGTPSSFWWFRGHYGTYDGEQYDNDSGNPGDIRWDDSGYSITVSGTVYAGEGTGGPGSVCDGVTPVVTIRVDGGSSYTGACNGTTGAYSISGVSFSGDVSMIAYLATAGTTQAATVTRTPTGDMANFDIYEQYVIVREEDVDPLTIAHMAVYDATQDSGIPFDASTSTNSLVVDPETALLVWTTKTFAPGGTVTLNSGGSGAAYDGTLVLATSSTYTAAGTEAIAVGGSWYAHTGSTFTSASSQVSFTATTTQKTIQPQSNFYDVVLSGSGGSWRVGSAMTVSNNLSVDSGTLYGTSSISVTNGTLSGNGAIDMTAGTVAVGTSGNFGGASDWSFYNLTLGDGVGGATTKVGAGTITTHGTLTIAANHTLHAGDDTWTLLGSGTALSVAGTFNADTSTTTYATTTAMTIAAVDYYALLLTPAGAGGPTYTFAAGNTGAVTLVVGDGVQPVTATADTNDPLITVQGDMTIGNGASFLASGSNDLLIGGSYDNSGTFTHNGGGVVFDSTDTGETVNPGGSSFHHLTFNGAGGGWTILDSATTTGNFSLTNGTSFTQQPGSTLEVQGTFTNTVGDGATDWTNTTLYLNSGTSYTLNTKSTGGDSYATLTLGANTDIRMWDSSATTYTIAPSGSLYSMDHAGTPGALYVFGDYVRSSGADYWSYATDFDGTDLSGGGERAVSVYLADGATTTLSGGSLEIVGGAGATTTIQNQGSGTYTFAVTGGTFQANYYAFRNMNGDGLDFSGAPTVTSLSDGDFELSYDGGSAMTIASTVLDANPVKTWYRVRFATSSGVSSGHNASTTGTSISSWRFTPTSGNYYGEQYDGDGGGDPGYLIWDDSAADIVVQGHVYSDEGTTVSGVCDGSTPVVRLMVQGVLENTVSCDSGSGQYTISGITYSPGDTLTVFLSGTGVGAANVTVDPITSIYNMDLYEHRVIIRHEDVSPITIADLAIYDSDQDTDIPFDADTGSPNTLSLPANTKLIVWTNKIFTPDGNVLLGSGTGTAYDGTLELRDGASYVASTTASETITVGGSWLTGTGASFTAGLSSVLFTGTSSGMVVSPDTSPFYDLTFNGVGGTWTFGDVNATTTNDFTISAGTVNIASSTLSVGGSFVNSGSMSAASTSITFTSGSTETVTFNGDSVGSLVFSGAGTYTMTDTYATSTGSVTIAAGSVSLPSTKLSVYGSFTNSGGSFTQSNGTLELYGPEAAQTLHYNGSVAHNLTITGTGSWTFVDSYATTTGTTTILAGGLTAPSTQFGIGGSLRNSGTFNVNGATLYFFATATGQTVNGGDAPFADVVFNGSGGGWTIATSSTSTGAWRIQSGAQYRQASSTTLEVQGIFQNLVGGTATDWTDSLLYLNASGTSYTVNTKSAGGDSYAYLTVGDNTDVRMWDSAGATTSVAASSSLYSMDHNGATGDLYIWGEYTRTSGADYWSYATDFDGTALGGSSRPVTVRVATSSGISYTGGSLAVVGASGATTSIAVQGSGAYAFSFAGASLNMQYYQLRDTDVNGLVLSGAPTVTSLSNGEYELAIDSGVTLSVAATVIDQNPTKTFNYLWFGTSTGVATGTNVKVTGSTDNYWQLLHSGGVFDGEYHDDDGVDACGSIRWSDSTCLEVSQAHYRFRADDGGEGAPDNEWMDADWSHRMRVTVSNPNASTLTNYPVRVKIPYETGMQSDFVDLRFTDSSGTTTIPYYIESYVTSATATVWAKVPSLPASDSANIFVYYGNSFATDGQNGANTFTIFDDFEDGSLSEYSGDTNLFATDASWNWQKSYGLAAASGQQQQQTIDGIYRTGTTVAQGSTIEWYQHVTSAADDEPCTLFGVQSPGSNNQNYAVCLDQFPGDRVIVAKDVSSNDGSGSVLASTTVTWSTDWYKVRVRWLTSDAINVTVYDSSGSVFASVATSDSSYTSGGFGFSFWYQADGWDFLTARPYAASDPTYTVSAPQQGGGASWKAAQDTAINQDSNTNFRVLLSVENSGPQITSQQFRLQYASKTGYGSCEAVPNVNYNDVPNVSGCGVSPVCMVSSAQFTDQDTTTQHLDTSSGLSFTQGYMVEDPSNQSTAMDVATSTLTELEYAVELTGFASESAYCLRTTDGGVELDSYAHVPEVSVNGVPVVTSWTLNEDGPIALTEGQTTVVMATGSVTDLNGFEDILYATSTIYRSGVGEACSADDNNCYRLNSLDCPLQNCSGNSCDIICSADIQFFADPTDQGSTYAGEDWKASVYVVDSTANVGTSTSLGVDINTMRAVSITTGEISYGTLAVNSDTGSANATSTVRNTGNVAIDMDLEGTDMSAPGSTIPVGNQMYATSSFAYSSCAICTALSGSASPYKVDLPKPTAAGTPVTDDIFWGLYVPLNTGGQTHVGQNLFTPIGDQG